MALNQDSAPVMGYFSSPASAELCVAQLRKAGFLNEQIGVSYAGSVVRTPANDPGVNRATDQQNSSSEIEDELHEAPGTTGMSALPTPNTSGFDSEWEAKEYQHPQADVVVSVSAEPHRREEARNLLHHYGARLADWQPPGEEVA